MWNVNYIKEWYDKATTPYVTAVKRYFWPLDENPRARKVHEHETRIIKDIGFVVSFQALSGFFNYMSKASIDNVNDSDESAWLTLNSTHYYCLSWISSLVAYRFLLKARTRTAPVYARHSAIFRKAEKELAEKGDRLPANTVPIDVCKDCNFSERAKSESFSLLTYYTEQFIIEHGVANIPYVGYYLYFLMSIIASGNQVVDNTLSPVLCATHREVYVREYWKFCFKEGLKVESATQLTAFMLSQLTGIDSSWCLKEIRTLFSMSEVERLQQQTLEDPKPGSISMANPSMIIQAAVRGAAKEILPQLVESLKEMMKRPGKPFDIVGFIKTVDKYHRNKVTQATLLMVLPHMLVNPSNFVNDEVIKDYWEPVRIKLLDILNLIKAYHTEWSTGYKGQAVNAATSIAPDMCLQALAKSLGIKKEHAVKLFDFARSDDYYKTDDFLRKMLTQDLAITQTLQLSAEDKLFLNHQSQAEQQGVSCDAYTLLTEKTLAAIKFYRTKDNPDNQFDFGSKREGRRRADIYKYLITQCASSVHKQFICYCALINDDGTMLSKRLHQKTMLRDSDMSGLKRYFEEKLSCDGEADKLFRLSNSINKFANSNPDEKDINLMRLCRTQRFISDLEQQFPERSSVAHFAMA